MIRMAVEKNNGDIISFVKQKDYVMVNNDLGGGSFGKAVILKDPYIDELFVAKKYEPEYEEIQERFYNNFLDEIKILYRLNHKNIVRIYNYYAYENIYTGYILMEFIDGKNIGEYLNGYEEFMSLAFNDPTPDSVFVQLIDAFCYIEDHKIIHRDIREGNIMVDKSGVVKVIDFGIGKIYDPKHKDDSLAAEINRQGSDTLPQEYYIGEYTTLTDMFYLAELLNRLMSTAEHPDEMHFSYQKILDKMMEKNPEDRYDSFASIKEAINKHDFTTMDISADDKRTYRAFVDLIHRSLASYKSEAKFITEPQELKNKLKQALKNNIFEDNIQNNSDVIGAIVVCEYAYYPRVKISCDVVKGFLKWFEESTLNSQTLILNNITSKLSTIPVIEPEPELPF